MAAKTVGLPWFRFYAKTVNSPKIQKLPGDLFKFWVNCMCVASDNGGPLPSIPDLSYILRIPERDVTKRISQLDESGLLDLSEVGQYWMHDWDEWQKSSDVSTERVKRFRNKHVKRDETVSETVQIREEEIRTEQNVSSVSETPQTAREVVQEIRRAPKLGPLGRDWLDAAWEVFESTGKPLNEKDRAAFARKSAEQNITDECGWTEVLPFLKSESQTWHDRPLEKIPFPASWVEKTPWTRRSRTRDPTALDPILATNIFKGVAEDTYGKS